MTFTRSLPGLALALSFLAVSALAVPAYAAGDAKPPKHVEWSFAGPLGTFDRASAQRGFQVFKEVCSACHSLNYFRFRNLAGIDYPEGQIKAIAAEYIVPGEPDAYGDPTERAALPKDAWPSPFPNEQAARSANGGALPPDLSVIVKARHHGPDYIYSLLTGYEEGPPPADLKIGDLQYYNPYFKGGGISMGPPLLDGLVEYQDGTEATLDQMARDVTVFLTYVAEPSMEARHNVGIRVIVFLLILTVLFYFSMKKIWKPVKAGRDVMEGEL